MRSEKSMTHYKGPWTITAIILAMIGLFIVVVSWVGLKWILQ